MIIWWRKSKKLHSSRYDHLTTLRSHMSPTTLLIAISMDFTQSNDDDDFRQWQRWIARANRIVNPFVEEQLGSKIANEGAQKREEAEPPIRALGAQKIDDDTFVARKEQ